MKPPRTLIFSLGNPRPYLNTLHSAGHHVLAGLQPLLGASQPELTWQRINGKKVNASLGPEHLLAWSPVLMNISGKFLSKAYRELLASEVQSEEATATAEPRTDGEPAKKPVLNLLLVHDDLEEDIGVVKIRKWGSSHRGHNGVKSVIGHMKPSDFPGAHWARISVGIGRPEARDGQTVSDYVLKEMSEGKMKTLRQEGAQGVLSCLYEWDEYLKSGTLPSSFKNVGAKPEDRARLGDRYKSWDRTSPTGSGNSSDREKTDKAESPDPEHQTELKPRTRRNP